MTDRNIDQINHNLDQVLAICADNTRGIAELRLTIAETNRGIAELSTHTRNRSQQHDLELDDHDERVERLERDHNEHADRMAKLEEIQSDIRASLQIMTRRFTGE